MIDQSRKPVAVVKETKYNDKNKCLKEWCDALPTWVQFLANASFNLDIPYIAWNSPSASLLIR